MNIREGNKSLGVLKTCSLGRKFCLSPVPYVTVDLRRVVNDMFHAGFAL